MGGPNWQDMIGMDRQRDIRTEEKKNGWTETHMNGKKDMQTERDMRIDVRTSGLIERNNDR